jgi:hypothetical protein
MRIVKIERYRGDRRYVYEVEERDLMKFGGEHIVKMKLQNEDSDVIEWLEEDFISENDAEEFDEREHGSYETEWFAEGDEI